MIGVRCRKREKKWTSSGQLCSRGAEMGQFGKWFRKNNSQYTFAACSAVVLYFILANLDTIFGAVGRFFGFFSPVFAGVVVAYIMNPLVKFTERRLFRKTEKRGAVWTASVAITVIAVVVLTVVLLAALLPQLFRSVVMFLENLDYYVMRLQQLLGDLSNGSTDTPIDFSGVTNTGGKLLDMLQTYISGNFGDLISKSTDFGHRVINFCISFVIAIYLLNDEKRILEYTERLFRMMIPADRFDRIAGFWNGCNRILIRYIICEILDACIVGVSNFVYMILSGSPYSVLISVVVGVTNLAPTFGPIVGGVIGTLILLLADPGKALAFIIFTNILQTIDGYVIKPRMYGDTLGISPILILISIIVGGRMFGAVGMILGIPFAAIMDYAFRKDTYLKDMAMKNLNFGSRNHDAES